MSERKKNERGLGIAPPVPSPLHFSSLYFQLALLVLSRPVYYLNAWNRLAWSESLPKLMFLFEYVVNPGKRMSVQKPHSKVQNVTAHSRRLEAIIGNEMIDLYLQLLFSGNTPAGSFDYKKQGGSRCGCEYFVSSKVLCHMALNEGVVA